MAPEQPPQDMVTLNSYVCDIVLVVVMMRADGLAG